MTPLRAVFWSLFLLLSVGGTALLLPGEVPMPKPVEGSIHCVGEHDDFQCWKRQLSAVTEAFGPERATVALKDLYRKNPRVVSECHQLAHSIGNTAVSMYPDLAGAFAHGDPFCWSGYYHGVVEEAVRDLGRDTFLERADSLCAEVPGKDRYSFDYYNCVHGLGHGLMAATRGALFESLDLCNSLSGDWEERSCYGGVFMENIMTAHRNTETSYLRSDDLLYPCTAVADRFKEECYKMQTSYALQENGYDFAGIFALCKDADEGFTDTCAESAGRDASGNSVSNVERTIGNCAKALDDRQKERCIVGAVRDFVSYFHGTVEARNLCFAVEKRFQATCEQAMLSHAATL